MTWVRVASISALSLGLLLFSGSLGHIEVRAQEGPDIPEGETWRYFKGTEEPPAGWMEPGFDDSGWLAGPSGLGYGDDDDNTVLSDMWGNYLAVYMRRAFTINEASDGTGLALFMDYDDGFVAYLNGTEIARHNVAGQPTPHRATAIHNHEASGGDKAPQDPRRYDLSDFSHLLRPGVNVLAVQGHNSEIYSSDFTLLPVLVHEKAFEEAPMRVRRPYLQMPRPDGMTIAWATKRAGAPTVRYGLDWRARGFNDSGWASGPSGLGYGDGDDATDLSDMWGEYLTLYARRTFTVPDPDAVTRMVLSMDYDDGFVAYLNGVEVARSNVDRRRPTHKTPASSSREASGGRLEPRPVESFDISDFRHLLRPGENLLAVTGHNVHLISPDLSLEPSLALYTPMPVYAIEPGDTWRYRKGREEPLALDLVAEGKATYYPALGGYYQHEVDLTGLELGTRYSYRVLVNGVEVPAGEPPTFRTAPDSPYFTFVAFADSGTGGTAQLALRDRLAQDRFNLAIMPGDVSQQSGDYRQIHRTFFEVYGEMLKNVPFVPTSGNHDYMTASAQPFLDMFVLPRNGVPGMEERFFSFDYANVHFVALDTEQIGPAQREWLEKDLRNTNQPWTVVYLHRTPFGAGSVHPPTQPGASQVRDQFAPLFEEYGVDLVLAGHNAVYGRTVPLVNARSSSPFADAAGVGEGGVVYVTTGGGGDILAEPYTDSFHQPPGASISMHHYTRVTVADCRLTLEVIDIPGVVQDTTTIDRCP